MGSTGVVYVGVGAGAGVGVGVNVVVIVVVGVDVVSTGVLVLSCCPRLFTKMRPKKTITAAKI